MCFFILLARNSNLEEGGALCMVWMLSALLVGSAITASTGASVVENIIQDREHCIHGVSVGKPSINELRIVYVSEIIAIVLFGLNCCCCFNYFQDIGRKLAARARLLLGVVFLWRTLICCLVIHIFAYVDALYNSNSKCDFNNAYPWALSALVFHTITFAVLGLMVRHSYKAYKTEKKANELLQRILVAPNAGNRTRTVNAGRGQPFGEANPRNKRTVITQLNNTVPSRSTSLRDAILAAVTMTRMIKEGVPNEASDAFTYVNVVVTDGEDTHSQTTLEELKVHLFLMDRILGKSSTTFLVGVGQTTSDFAELKSLAGLLDTVHFMHINSNDCSEIFQRIQLQLGIQRQIAGVVTENAAVIAQRDQLVLGVGLRRFVVIFTIDKSGSMSGTRWRSTCAGLSGFLDNLTEHDLFGVQLFNDEVSWIHM